MRRALALVFVVWFAAAAAGIGVRGSYGGQTTGDEPHYLVTALSIAEDRSLDVRDEYAAGAYRPFHEARLTPQARELEDGRLVEPHDPLLPALLAVPLALGGWVAAKLALALVAGALGALLLWTAARRFGVGLRPAVVTFAALGGSLPLAAYGNQVYPELTAALVATVGLTFPLAAAVVLPWLSVKYAAVALVFAVIALARSRHRFATVLALGMATYIYIHLHHRWYGGFTPYAAGAHFDGAELTAVGHDPQYLGRSRRLLGLLVDRHFGLAVWQPAWLLLVPALGALIARRPPRWTWIAAPLAAGWAVATWAALTMHGWWFPGRQLVVVLPLAALAIAWWAGRSRRALQAVAVLGSVGVAVHVAFLVQAYARPLTWAVDFWQAAPPWRHVLPEHMDPGAWDWALTALWAVVLAYALKTATRREWGRTETRAPSGTTSVDGRWATSGVPSRSTR